MTGDGAASGEGAGSVGTNAADGADALRAGFTAGAAAYALWGLFPLYFRLLDPTSAVEVLCHRIVWTFLTMAVVLTAGGDRSWISRMRQDRRTLVLLGSAAVLVSLNWLVYVWAVEMNRVVEASLGYFICPLVTVALGVVVLGERLRTLQWIAMGLGTAAVAVLSVAYGSVPWIALTLAATFSAYGFIKKKVQVGAAVSLTVETAVVAPVAMVGLAVLAANGEAQIVQGDPGLRMLLVGTGVVTALPLVLFAAAARRIPLSSLGLMQYLTPSLQFVLGIVVFDETMSAAQWVGFGIVWAAVVVLSVDAVRAARTDPTDPAVGPAAAELG